jgi:hypothetical protein
MNLVKAQEYAQSLPLAELKKYADGFNPAMIPPWLATGEMQAKMKRAEMANAMQGAANGPQPSVKEQIEQKAGVMALQQAQQAQQQQMGQRPMPGPVPEGTPQPNPQPQPQPAGLNQLPSNIQMAGGGIVAFATGNEVKAGPAFIKFLQQLGIDYVEFAKSAPEAQEAIKDMFRSGQGAAAPAAQTAEGATAAAEAARKASMLRNISEGAGRFAGAALRKAGPAGLGLDAALHMGDYKIQNPDNIDTSAAGTIRDLAKGEFGRAGTGLKRGLGEAAMDLGSVGANMLDYVVPGKAPVSGAYDRFLKENVEGLRGPESAGPERGRPTMANDPRLDPNFNTSPTGPGANAPAAPPAARSLMANPNAPRTNAPAANPNAPQNVNPAAPAPDSMEALFRKSLENKPKERSIKEQLAEQNAIRSGAGLDEPAGKAKLERIAELNKQYESTKPTGIQELIQMLGQSGQYKGLSGLAPAYSNIQAQKRAADLAHAQKINDLMGSVEDTQRAEKTGVASEVVKGRDKDRELGSQFDRERMQQLASTRGQDKQAETGKYSADMHYKAAMAQIKSTAAREGLQQQRLLLDTFKAELATIDKELAPLLKAPFGPAKDQIAELQARKTGLTKALDEASGISKMMPAPDARRLGGTRPPLSSFQR